MTFVYDTCEAMTDVSVALQLPYTQCRLGASCFSYPLSITCFALGFYTNRSHQLFLRAFCPPHDRHSLHFDVLRSTTQSG